MNGWFNPKTVFSDEYSMMQGGGGQGTMNPARITLVPSGVGTPKLEIWPSTLRVLGPLFSNKNVVNRNLSNFFILILYCFV